MDPFDPVDLSPGALDLLREHYAERLAFARISVGVSFLDCLTAHGLARSIEVTTEQGKTCSVRGSDVYDRRTWNAFLHATELLPTSLIQDADRLVQAYEHWLRSAYTPRYRAITSPDQRAWLRQVVILAVLTQVLEQRCQQISNAPGTGCADPWVQVQMTVFLQRKAAIHEVARLIGHLVAEREQAQHYLTLITEQVLSRLMLTPPAPL